MYPNNDSYRWYLVDGEARQYLPRKENKIAEDLALKKYYQLKKNALLEKRENIMKRQCESYDNNEKLHKFLNNEGYIQLIGHLLSGDSFAEKSKSVWANEEYRNNPKYPEQLTNLGSSGNYLRSNC